MMDFRRLFRNWQPLHNWSNWRCNYSLNKSYIDIIDDGPGLQPMVIFQLRPTHWGRLQLLHTSSFVALEFAVHQSHFRAPRAPQFLTCRVCCQCCGCLDRWLWTKAGHGKLQWFHVHLCIKSSVPNYHKLSCLCRPGAASGLLSERCLSFLWSLH